MRKVLIISYYWPPAGGGGVQRWLKFAKYLPQYGWSPVVYTPSNADYPLIDPSLEGDVSEDITVIRRPIREVRRVYASLPRKGRKGASGAHLDQLFYRDPQKRTWRQQLAVWIRSNWFIPDARVWWVRPSVRFLSRYLRKESIDIVVTTGPPHSMHLIGLKLQQSNERLRWVADFRDPWTDIEYYDHMPLTGRADKKHRRLERLVLQSADTVITVSPSWADMLARIRDGHVHTITNGYDAEDFSAPAPALDTRTTVCHVGTLALDRNLLKLWKSLAEVRLTAPPGKESLQVKLVGSTDPAVLETLTELGLDHIDLGYVDHARAVAAMQSARALLLLVNTGVKRNAQGRIPGKVFEYLAAGRPIIGVCPENSDVAGLLREHDHLVLDPARPMSGATISSFLERAPQAAKTNIEMYSRSYLAGGVANVLDRTMDNVEKDL